jgi:hypothetical protein
MLLTACGLKSNPVPYSIVLEQKPVVNNLEAVSTDGSIFLKWNFRDSSGLISYIGIERSEAGSPGNECKDCPRTFARIGQVSVKASKPADKELRTLSFADEKVVEGKSYKYRLMLCEDNGNCTESAAVEKIFNK